MTWFLIAVRQEVKRIDNSVVVHALELAIKRDLKCLYFGLASFFSNDIVSTKIYDKLDGFDFEIVNLPFLDGDVPRSTSYGVYMSQLIRFARASSHGQLRASVL